MLPQCLTTGHVSVNQEEYNMARYTGPKNKLSRREGVDLMGKGVKLRRLSIPPGVHGPKTKGKKQSNFGIQLREKQKVKRSYGLLERQFKNYVNSALITKGNTAESLFGLLERRIDNVIYKSGLVPTRNMARQLVVHGHIKVDGKKVDKPSYSLKPGQVITISDKASKMPTIIKQIELAPTSPSTWINRKSAVIEFKEIPTLSDTTEVLSWNSVIEYYSR